MGTDSLLEPQVATRGTAALLGYYPGLKVDGLALKKSSIMGKNIVSGC